MVATTAVEDPGADGRPGGRWAVLKAVAGNRDLRRVQLAFLGSAIGDWAYATAILVWVFQQSGAHVVGVWVGVRFLLGALTAPLGALLADRWPRRRLMMATDAVRALLVAAVAVLVASGAPLLSVLVLSTLASLLSSPFLIAQRALLPSLAATPAQLTAANGVHSTIDSTAAFAGPALAAGLLVVLDVPVVLWFNVLTFLWSLALVSRVTVPSRPEATTGSDAAADPGPAGASATTEEAAAAKETFLAETMAGFAAIRRDRALLLSTVQVALQTLVAGASPVFLVVLAAEVLGSEEGGLGALNAVIGIGSVLGGFVAISRAGKETLGRDMVVGVVLWSAPLLLISVWPVAAVCFLAVALLGLANPLVDVNVDTIFQRLTPDRMLGRVFGALESCVIGTMALGAFLMPFALELGLRVGLAVLAAPVALVALLSLPTMVRLDRTMTAPPGLDLLRSVDLFAPLDPATTDQLARALGHMRFGVGEVLLREGETSELFYVVESGLVEVRQGERVLRTEGPGEYFGEIGLLRDVPRTATVTALEDTVVRTLSREDFLQAVSGHSAARTAAESVVARRLAA
ncbi:MFS transporter [Aquipuribacter sp. SD81]|uniref:MFS transporter n=1 Tax=Aquipuribacter sp. SD81 TaxID=3127703 RepID=UPI00301B2204